MATVSVRYIVNDVDTAITFYCGHLGFEEVMHPAPTFAMLARGDLRLVLNAPGGGPGGGQAMPDGTVPTPGRWNRFALEVTDLDEADIRQVGQHRHGARLGAPAGAQDEGPLALGGHHRHGLHHAGPP